MINKLVSLFFWFRQHTPIHSDAPNVGWGPLLPAGPPFNFMTQILATLYARASRFSSDCCIPSRNMLISQ
jgi:hypothetical protein